MVLRPWRRIRLMQREMERSDKQAQIALSAKNYELDEAAKTINKLDLSVREAMRDAEAAYEVLRALDKFEPTPTNPAAQRVIEVPQAVRGIGRNHEVWWRWFGASMLREGIDIQARGEDMGDFYWGGDFGNPTRIVINIRKAQNGREASDNA